MFPDESIVRRPEMARFNAHYRFEFLPLPAANPFSGTRPRYIGGSISRRAIPTADRVTSNGADTVNASPSADGHAIHVDWDDATFGRLACRTGCAPRRYPPNRADVVRDVLHRDEFGHRPHHRLRGNRALGHNLAADRGRPPPNNELPMTVIVLYPEDRQIPDLAPEPRGAHPPRR
jgi:hypothetical protein